ncbi:MAG: hypothetical protein P1V97_05590 [Planctomycetota bacterium]|nr:hypothetical protein [Planctomycetota bacterium]
MDPLEQFQVLARDKDIREFQLYSVEQNRLILTGSRDHAYYHQIELRFENTRYMSIPMEFSDPIFRYGEEDDYERIRRIVELENQDLIIHVEAETPAALEPQNFYIVAQTLTLDSDMVYHYQRENLVDGERLASWA